MSNFFSISVLAELACLFVAVFFLRRSLKSLWGMFIIYLTVVVLVELTGFSFRSSAKNFHAYHFLWVVQTIFFSLFFRKALAFEYSSWPVFGAFLLIGWFIGEGLARNFTVPNYLFRQALGIYTVFLCCLYFYGLLRDNETKVPTKIPEFWIAVGLFFFYLGTIGVFAFRSFAAEERKQGIDWFYQLIIDSACVILYGSWIIAFICQKNQTPSSNRS